MKHIDVKKLIAEMERLKATNPSEYNYQNAEGYIWALEDIKKFIDSAQQEQPTNTDNLCSELVDFLIRNDISEEKAKFLANRISDIYGSQRYIDGLCDGLKREQPEIDIDKIVGEYLLNNSEFLIEHDSKTVVQALARHFYELGKNSK